MVDFSSAGAMTPPATLQSQQQPRPGRKPKRTGEPDEPGKKPKKVNSEIRKQQNRIASRNYREKRKRKLQYLQQLLKDGNSSDHQGGHSSEHDDDPRARSLSADYHMPGPSSGSIVFSANNDINSWGASNSGVIDPVLAATTAPFDSHLLATTQPYPSFESSWDAPVYEAPAPVNMANSWAMNTWMPGMNFNSPPATSRPESYQYTPPPTHPAYDQLPTPPQQPQEFTPSPDMFVLGSYRPNNRRPTSQSRPFSNFIINQQTPLRGRSIFI